MKKTIFITENTSKTNEFSLPHFQSQNHTLKVRLWKKLISEGHDERLRWCNIPDFLMNCNMFLVKPLPLRSVPTFIELFVG